MEGAYGISLSLLLKFGCVYETEIKKIKIVDKEFLTLHLKNDSSTSTFEIGENVYLFAFISSSGVCI